MYTSKTGLFLYSTCIENTIGGIASVLVLSSQNKFGFNVKEHEPLASSDHSHMRFNIKVKIHEIHVNTNGEETRIKI